MTLDVHHICYIVRGTPDKINVLARGGDKSVWRYKKYKVNRNNPLPTSRKDP